ncbi:hypothetical protein F7734_24535 [Scytonema sp. UIC 10036]|uniref:VOC family protein n=1 Tax=Scytonema sp. UIC 10036 TaxID=2304196 RepID=UPI0012DA2408|nr:VOC family protein [Scytonema sp. UIC 10036]MUG95361.1 hypothetical protein [Scytonema sp. UIC 10036]
MNVFRVTHSKSPPPINQQITFLYTNDLATSTEFYEDKLGLKLWLDQGNCRIYTVTGSRYLGLCQRNESATKEDAVRTGIIFTIATSGL